jgi:hypothetical protein
MTVIEAPVPVEEREDLDDHEHGDLECHLYTTESHDRTLCGVARGNDPHRHMHSGFIPWEKGMTACPACSAPICLSCLLAAN